MKKLVIVESPSKAVKIQEYLGDEYIVVASKGHITDLAKGGKHGIGVDIDNDFKPKYVLKEDSVKILANIMEEAKKCDIIYLFSDPDREGNSISWHLQERLKDLGKPFKRGLLNKIEKNALKKAIAEAGEIDMKSVKAQETRRILDRIVGFKSSPFLQNTIKAKSAGRVQSVLTRLVIDREREIEAFVPETYFTILANLSKNKKDSFTVKYADKLTDQKIAKDIFNQISNTNDEFIVKEVTADEEKRLAPAPLITSTLQQVMSKTYSIGADATMKAAQSLFENGYVTYIRTDSVRTSDEALKELRDYLKDNKLPASTKTNTFKNKDSAQDAHECLRPVDISLLPDNNNYAIIDPTEKKIYEVIWKYFVASQMAPAVFSTLKVTVNLKSNPKIELKVSGKAIKSLGYLEILGNSENSKIDIPNLSVGDVLYLFGSNPSKLEKKKTQPPPRYSESNLIKELDERGIGRPATYATLLATICTRDYVEKKGNVYHATDLGKKVTDLLFKYFSFMDFNFTADMETQLDKIEAGKTTSLEVLNKFYPDFKKQLDKAYLGNGQKLCNKCSHPMVTKKLKATGQSFQACSNYPACKNAEFPLKESTVNVQ